MFLVDTRVLLKIVFFFAVHFFIFWHHQFSSSNRNIISVSVENGEKVCSGTWTMRVETKIHKKSSGWSHYLDLIRVSISMSHQTNMAYHTINKKRQSRPKKRNVCGCWKKGMNSTSLGYHDTYQISNCDKVKFVGCQIDITCVLFYCFSKISRVSFELRWIQLSYTYSSDFKKKNFFF